MAFRSASLNSAGGCAGIAPRPRRITSSSGPSSGYLAVNFGPNSAGPMPALPPGWQELQLASNNRAPALISPAGAAVVVAEAAATVGGATGVAWLAVTAAAVGEAPASI